MVYFLAYLLITSLISFAFFGIDKRKANHQKRRISENMLLYTVAAGGWIGGVAGMSYFRHKTIKSSFLWKFRCIAGIRMIVTIVVMAYLQ